MHPSVRVVFTEHGRLAWHRHFAEAAARQSGAGAMAVEICAVSAALKQDMVAEGFPERSIEVVYNGIELGRRPQPADRAAARSALQLPDDAFVIGSVGRLDPVKNLARSSRRCRYWALAFRPREPLSSAMGRSARP
jgi:glycosyltransferase involved in cell wall biosynthesis